MEGPSQLNSPSFEAERTDFEEALDFLQKNLSDVDEEAFSLPRQLAAIKDLEDNNLDIQSEIIRVNKAILNEEKEYEKSIKSKEAAEIANRQQLQSLNKPLAATLKTKANKETELQKWINVNSTNRSRVEEREQEYLADLQNKLEVSARSQHELEEKETEYKTELDAFKSLIEAEALGNSDQQSALEAEKIQLRELKQNKEIEAQTKVQEAESKIQLMSEKFHELKTIQNTVSSMEVYSFEMGGIRIQEQQITESAVIALNKINSVLGNKVNDMASQIQNIKADFRSKETCLKNLEEENQQEINKIKEEVDKLEYHSADAYNKSMDELNERISGYEEYEANLINIETELKCQFHQAEADLNVMDLELEQKTIEYEQINTAWNEDAEITRMHQQEVEELAANQLSMRYIYLSEIEETRDQVEVLNDQKATAIRQYDEDHHRFEAHRIQNDVIMSEARDEYQKVKNMCNIISEEISSANGIDDMIKTCEAEKMNMQAELDILSQKSEDILEIFKYNKKLEDIYRTEIPDINMIEEVVRNTQKRKRDDSDEAGPSKTRRSEQEI